MKFSINSKSLLSVLSAANKVVPAKSAILILTNFKIDVKDGEIVVTASDTENRVSIAAQAITDGQGSFCIEAKFLLDIVRSLPDCQVTVDVSEDGAVSITTEKNSFNAVAQKSDQYPDSDFSETAALAEFQIPTETLLAGFAETSFAVGTNDFHPHLMGVCFDAKPDEAVFVATDTRQLVKSAQQAQPGVDARCIVPTKAISAVSATAAKESNVIVQVYPSAIVFSGESFSLRCQLLKGNYPDYNRVIPQNNNIVATFKRAELLGAVRRVSACADSAYGMLRLSLNDDTAEISTRDDAFSRSAKETVSCDSNNIPIRIGLSSGILTGMLSAIQSECVQLRFSDPSRPALITPVGDDHLTMLLMPMNLGE